MRYIHLPQKLHTIIFITELFIKFKLITGITTTTIFLSFSVSGEKLSMHFFCLDAFNLKFLQSHSKL